MADDWDAFPTATPAAPASAAPPKDDPWSAFPTAGGPAAKPAAPKPTGAEAFGRGVMTGATFNFYDELTGLARAGGLAPDDPDVANAIKSLVVGGYRKLTGNEEAERLYNEQVGKTRAQTKEMETEHPYASGAGNVAGAVAVPAGIAARAASLPVRMLRGAGAGALFGGLSGVGEGEGATDRAARGITGAGIGAGIGAIAPPLVEGVLHAGSAAARPIVNAYRGLTNPEGEAGRRVITALERDMQTQGPSLTAQEIAVANQANVPRAIVDTGGEATRALARSAANTSPEAREGLTRFTSDRFGAQNERAAEFVDHLVGGAQPNVATREALETAARQANRPAYDRAYHDPAAQRLWDEGLEQLAQAPVVQQAIQMATITGRNRGALQGFPPFANPFTLDRTTNRMELRTGADGSQMLPNLQFWDHVKRNLDRVGSGEARAAARVLREHLDDLVPSYQNARAGAARFFDADEAVEAGANFVTSKMRNEEARRALARMSPAERQLFQHGYASALIARVSEHGDRRSIQEAFGQSPAARERVEIALGPQRARQLETFLHVENVVDRARNAVMGNSTSARQFAELGLAGGAYGIGTAGDVLHPNPQAIAGAAITYGLTRGHHRINENLARRVGQMLVSNDPNVLARGVQLVARHNAVFDALRGMGSGASSRIGGQQSANVPALQSLGIGRASDDQPQVPRPGGQQKYGGRVGQEAEFAHGGSVEGSTPPIREQADGGPVLNEDTISADMARRAAAQRLRDSVQRRFAPVPQRAHGGGVDAGNIHPEPTQAQKEAGNYAKDHVRVHGLDISIENAKGASRSGVDRDGKAWSVKMPAHYGYIKGSVGADKDHVDCYLGPHVKSPKVFVVDQLDAESGKFDEHKCMLGFGSKAQAVATYRKGFSDGRASDRLGHVTEMGIDQFKHWLANGNTRKPAKEAA